MGTFYQQNMPSVLDKEVSDLSKDAFGHHHFANALRSLIEGSHRPPFSIGLLGTWGTGKSTIKELYLSSLASDSTGPTGKKRANRFRPIIFNAWRYGGDEDIKRALLRHVFLQLGGDDVELRRRLYQQVTDSAQTSRGFGEWLKEAVLQNIASAGLFLLLLVGSIGVIWTASYGLGLSDQWGLSVVLSVAAIVAAFLGKYVVDIRLKSPTLFNNQTVISFPTTSAEEYERLLVDQIKKFRAGREGRSCERLVIFVDDLDRLSAAEMVSGLDAVRTFLELPLGDGSENFGIIFVISCDEDRVADALSRGRGRINPDLPGSVFTRSDARRYLDRLFQFRLEIPPFPKLDMRQFAEKKLREMGDIAASIEEGHVTLQDVVERLIHVGVQSPRNAIQLLNAFTQTWWIAIQRERSGIGSSAPGVLYDGAVSKHPVALAALCVLRVDFPDFYSELQRHPELIQDFTRVVFRGVPFNTLSANSQHALKEFLVVQGNEIGHDVRVEHRNLRQYLSSLLDLRWPRSLQPLLLLAQDAISRKYGDRAAELHDAFVSGDTRGVLEIFGHHLDNAVLDRDDVRLLEDLAEGLPDDTQTRRVSAARVLAAIAHRIPADTRNGLMVPLARQMISLKDIRTNVGPTAAREIISALPAADRREVAESFGKDLLTGQKLEWRLPSGETPNLEELVSDANAAAELALDVRKSNGLSSATDVLLKAWLLGREVQSSQGSQSVPFSQLEKWMEEHPNHLLDLLGADYADLAIGELERNPTAIPDKMRTLQRIGLVSEKLAEGGQESREVLWVQVTRLVAMRDPQVSSAAWKEAGLRAALATGQQARAFLIAFASRLEKEMTDADQWGLDWNAGAQRFLDLAARWDAFIDSGCAEGVLPLTQSWGEIDETSAYMTRAAEILLRRDRDTWDRLIEHLTKKTFGELPWPSLEYIAIKLSELNDIQKSTLADQMNALVNGDTIGSEDAEKYAKFIAAAPEDAWSSAPLLAHSKVSRSRVVAMATRVEYLSAIFPAARALLSRAPKGQTANVLTPLFEQAAGAPSVYPILHREMIGKWPEENDQTGPYGPNAIASRAIQFIRENPALEGSGDVFQSVVDMASRNVVTESTSAELSGAAVILWPHSPRSVVSSIAQIASLMSIGDIKRLLTGNQSDNTRANIQAIVDALSGGADEARCLAIAKELLSSPPKQIDDMPDGALSVWLLAAQKHQAKVVQALLIEAGLTDEQRERVLSYVIAQREKLGLAFFTAMLPSILRKAGEPKSLGIVINRIDNILSLAKNSDQRSSLVTALVPTLQQLTGDHLAIIARAIHDLGGKGAVERNTELLETMDANQLAILARELPGSKAIARHISSQGKATGE
ncbi:KAP family NTPase (plasmid) [Ensifer adhaerens]|uniref:P-loop NTPase fold protein n=1 Tax=Ensifer adhaerens TaxID=106592 RepID=UPI001CBDD376|nr:P-loop NTPase fold protein [Ensifer adhaerens]MBZ7927077.1 KAP family NTPase [Ensifer adhaerens]UAX98123.1 KAP family NTPase [Ensifer adhaerens]UAY05504.1 KAP family NTPase [Ensifer adhaerens]UAY12882.1 KAP family NTPase [Ensifer adhaerens]